MSGFQFIHIEAYARRGSQQQRKEKSTGKAKLQQKWSIREIVEEAARIKGACPHVTNPQPPNVLHGGSPHEAARLSAEWAGKQKDSLGRKMRMDGLCMLAGVVSLPAERISDWVDFRDATIKYLINKYGERLKSVIEHTDEEHPHLHFYAVPLHNERFDLIHDGRKASAEMAALGKKKGAQNKAYIEAMRKFQDEFYQNVAVNFGLTRDGPRRRRLTRAQWQIEQKSARRNANMLTTAREAHCSTINDSKIKDDALENNLREMILLRQELETVKSNLKKFEEMISPEELEERIIATNNKKDKESANGASSAPDSASEYLDSFVSGEAKNIAKKSGTNQFSVFKINDINF